MYEFAYNEVIEDSRQTMRARERQAMDRVIAMLRGAQEKGTRLHDALVEAKKAWPHWICSQCRTFNGESKQPRLACRACGSLREGQTGR